MRVDINIQGDIAVVGRLEGLPARLRVVLRRKVSYLTLYLENYIKTQKLSGQILNVVSGRLRRSIFSKITETEQTVSGQVSSSGDVKYAAIHEYGYDGPETVRAHTRTIKEAFGKAISPKTIFVNSFVRQMHMPERSFMRSSFVDLKDMLRLQLEDAVREGVSGQ